MTKIKLTTKAPATIKVKLSEVAAEIAKMASDGQVEFFRQLALVMTKFGPDGIELQTQLIRTKIAKMPVEDRALIVDMLERIIQSEEEL